jgi:ComF family protein
MNPWLRAAVETALRIVAPPTCAACDASLPGATAFCAPCAATLVRAENLDPARVAAFEYGGAIAEALRRFKFDGRPDLSRALLAGLSAELPRIRTRGIDVVVPVPLHPSRLVERGYNQAALLAGPLSRLVGAPFRPRALGRRISTRRQTELGRAPRAANVAGAFVVLDPASIQGRQVLLVDDVETTGATLAACSAALRDAGAGSTQSVVIARAQARNDEIHRETHTPPTAAL